MHYLKKKLSTSTLYNSYEATKLAENKNKTMEIKRKGQKNKTKKNTYFERPFSNIYCSSTDQSTAKAASCLSPVGEFTVRWNPDEVVMLEFTGYTKPVVLVLGTQ